jgi:hypothetical protein
MSDNANETPPSASADDANMGYPCECLPEHARLGAALSPTLHTEEQDESVAGWRQLTKLVEELARSEAEHLAPGKHIAWEDWQHVITLPREVATLTRLREFHAYGSNLRRLPPEIGRIPFLRKLDIYTSYALHWLPYEIVRCEHLYWSAMSTRTLYGNKKTRLPFPRLTGPVDVLLPETCSVCDRSFEGRAPQVCWTTQRIGTDDVPLLIHGCSKSCIDSVPSAPPGYVARPHKGGSEVQLPPDYW